MSEFPKYALGVDLPRFVLGIDPGKMTGVALYDIQADHITGGELREDETGKWLELIIHQVRPAVACEAFVITSQTAKNSAAPWSLEFIGVARYLAAKYECPFTLQAQAASKGFATDARLKRLGWYARGKGHMTDAQRQTLLYLVSKGWWHDALTVIDGPW